MNAESITAYPLCWPPAWPRSTRKRQPALFKDISIARATDQVLAEVRRLGCPARKVIVSTNLVLNLDGSPRSSQRMPEDPAVAVYFELNGERLCMSVDRWNRVEHNLRAVALCIGAMRGMDRWGAKEMVKAAFTGFKALPQHCLPVVTRKWWEVLDCHPRDSIFEIKNKYKDKARFAHPDHSSGSQESMVELNRALQEARDAQEDRE